MITRSRFLRNGRDVAAGAGILRHQADNYFITGDIFLGMGAAKKAISVCSNTTTKYDETDEENNQYASGSVQTRTCQ